MKPTGPEAVRSLTVADYEPITSIVDDWWGGRPVRSLLSRLFFEHFNPTSFVVETNGELQAFLIGFISQTDSGIAYIHFVGVNPAHRQKGLGRLLYSRFFQVVSARGCKEVRCITSPVNTGSIAFHQQLGFEILTGDAVVDGISVTLDHGGPGQPRVCFRKVL
ncbi:MAG: GNAT family N-acetyltransferase [Armatimonas sp.]